MSWKKHLERFRTYRTDGPVRHLSLVAFGLLCSFAVACSSADEPAVENSCQAAEQYAAECLGTEPGEVKTCDQNMADSSNAILGKSCEELTAGTQEGKADAWTISEAARKACNAKKCRAKGMYCHDKMTGPGYGSPGGYCVDTSFGWCRLSPYCFVDW